MTIFEKIKEAWYWWLVVTLFVSIYRILFSDP